MLNKDFLIFHLRSFWIKNAIYSEENQLVAVTTGNILFQALAYLSLYQTFYLHCSDSFHDVSTFVSCDIPQEYRTELFIYLDLIRLL